MSNYIAVIFKSDAEAAAGLHKLWKLDDDGAITMHSAAIIRRNAVGDIEVSTKSTHPGVRTALGIGLGALVGALAGPVGVAAGVTVAAGAGIGAAAGGVVGLAGDTRKAVEHDELKRDLGFEVASGESAVVADVSEDWVAPVDDAMKALGGRVYRRDKRDVQANAFFGDYGNYMYPYDYEPYFAEPHYAY